MSKSEARIPAEFVHQDEYHPHYPDVTQDFFLRLSYAAIRIKEQRDARSRDKQQKRET